MAIDLHAHWVPRELARALRERSDAVPRIEPGPAGGERLVMPIGTLAFHPGYVEPAGRLAFMDRVGVRRQLLSLPGLFGVDSLPVAESAPLVRGFNDALAALCRTHPLRFAGLAALPLADTDAAVAELRRARQDLGLLGAILPVDAFLCEADAARIAPIFAAGDELGAHFFVHPGRMPGNRPLPPAPRDHELARRALAVQHEVGEAMVTLLLSEFLQPWSNVTVHVANLGGTFPAVVERMDHMVQLRDPARSLPSSRAHRVWVDCASLGAGALQQAVRVFGADKVVLGTDCPIFDTERTLAAVREAGLSAPDQQRILTGNADALLARLA
ncbi:amidohydrolase family protein [Ramlibacter sp. PS3R-8]|uniref:amidohydrolase family protein n=1 Tax=Ramlibacter sp. PS3R-8 TaxID=3133437 RepID=UPI0030A97690